MNTRSGRCHCSAICSTHTVALAFHCEPHPLQATRHLSSLTSTLLKMMYNRIRPRRPRRRNKWKTANELVTCYDTSTEADTSADEAGTSSQPLRPLNMNTFASQPTTRQTPRLQNTSKSGLGNGTGGWGGFGLPSSGGAFGGLGGAPGLGGQARPGQLSGFAQVMGGGSGQGPIDMR